MKVKEMIGNNTKIEHAEVLIKDLEIKQTKKNVNYLFLRVQDETGSIPAMIWQIDTNKKAQKLEIGQAIYILNGSVSVYNDNTSITINDFDIDYNNDIDIDSITPSAPISEDDLKNNIEKVVSLIKNPTLHTITERALDLVGDKFYTQPAATFMHHEFKGGLAYHTYCMLQAAGYYSKIYKDLLNTDLLFSGIILHDLGKVDEINNYIDTSKTLNGELLGHINIVNDIITKIIIEEQLTDLDLITELKHIVLSHHGELEWGSNVTPKTAEAQIIHYIDQIDAKMMMFQKAYDNLQNDATFTTKVFGIHNNKLYKRQSDI